jgi:hypothetical protein
MRRSQALGLARDTRPQALPLRVSAGISPDFPHDLACSVVLADVTFPRQGKRVNNAACESASQQASLAGSGVGSGGDRAVR